MVHRWPGTALVYFPLLPPCTLPRVDRYHSLPMEQLTRTIFIKVEIQSAQLFYKPGGETMPFLAKRPSEVLHL